MKKKMTQPKVVSVNPQFDRIKRRVLKKFPDAKTTMTPEGRYKVSNGYGGYIGDEVYLPSQSTIMDAWYWANECLKTIQNINRTHPDKNIMIFDEKGFNRVSSRNFRKNKKVKLDNN